MTKYLYLFCVLHLLRNTKTLFIVSRNALYVSILFENCLQATNKLLENNNWETLQKQMRNMKNIWERVCKSCFKTFTNHASKKKVASLVQTKNQIRTQPCAKIRGWTRHIAANQTETASMSVDDRCCHGSADSEPQLFCCREMQPWTTGCPWSQHLLACSV